MPGDTQPTSAPRSSSGSVAGSSKQVNVELPPYRPSAGDETPVTNLSGNEFSGAGRSSSTVSSARLQAGSRGSIPPTSGRNSRSAPLLEDQDVPSRSSGSAVNEVAIVEVAEWGGGMGFSSSDESDLDLPGGPSDPTPAGGVRVVQVSAEWADGDSHTIQCDADMENRRGKNRDTRKVRMQGSESGPMATGTGSDMSTINPKLFGRAPRDITSMRLGDKHWFCKCLKRQSTRFVVISLLHIGGYGLQWWCIMVYALWHSEDHSYSRVLFLMPIQVMGSGLASYMTFHDNDVVHQLHRVRNSGIVAHYGCVLFACVFLGLLQAIAVKRAWKRQMYDPDIFDEDDLHAATADSIAYGGAERALPIALFTGVPFLLVNSISVLTAKWRWQPWEQAVLWAANLLTLFNVSLGIIEIDVAVSSYVMKRYHLDPSRGGKRAGYFQWLYPFAHVLFRASEVFLRVTMICEYSVILRVLLQGAEWVAVGFLVDYFVGFGLLKYYSLDKERFTPHAVIAGILMIADVAHFVDQPNFAYPAKKISQHLSKWRLLSVVILVAMIAVFRFGKPPIDDKDCEPPVSPEKEAVCRWNVRKWLFEFDKLIFLTAWYLLLRLAPWNRKVGDDLHTAALSRNKNRIKKLLEPDDQGQVLDVNGTTRDHLQMTPAMFAAMAGDEQGVEVLRLLHEKGADMNMKNEDGDTPLHLAAQYGKADACEWLLDEARAPLLPNNRMQMPTEIVGLKASRWNKSNPDQSRTEEVLMQRAQKQRRTSLDQQMGVATLANVPAVMTASNPLKGLFPDMADDDSPSPRALQSVSGLVFSRAAGALARCVLARETDSGAVSLGTLKRVGELGKGGFGKVIEVEFEDQGGRTLFLRRQSVNKRYALKLQLKHRVNPSAFSENFALRTVQHPFIVRLERAFNMPNYLALLLELCPRDLNRILCEDHQVDGRCIGLGHQTTARYMGQVLLAVVHLQKSGIVYRDLKPENILISTEDQAKLTDFGLAKVVTSADRFDHRVTVCGTMGFFPPELLWGSDDDSDRSHATASVRVSMANLASRSSSSSTDSRHEVKSMMKLDTYSYGVTLQLALLGEDGGQKKEVRRKGAMMLPYWQKSERENQEMLLALRSNEKLSDEALRLLLGDEECKKLLKEESQTDDKPREVAYKGLLPFNPDRRTTLDKVVNHPFFCRELDCQDLYDHFKCPRK